MDEDQQARTLRALTPRAGRVAMVLDTDTYNEIDDQFALAYAMHSKDRLDVKAVYAAPFHNARSTGPADGMEKSYEEIVRLLDRMNVSANGFAFKGAQQYLESPDTPVMSPAVEDLIARSREYHNEDRLYVVAIGAITNVASALIADPTIADRVVIVWLGGNAMYWPHTQEFNLAQDIASANVVFSSGAPLVLVPCKPVATHTLTTLAELERDLGRGNELTAFLVDRFAEYSREHFAYSKEIWDIAPIAWLLKDEWAPSHLDHSPIVQSDFRYSIDRRRHLIRVVDELKRNAIFGDMFRKLSG